MEEESGKRAVLVTNLYPDFDEESVKELFSSFGNISRCKLLQFELS